jgi:hypothetical protein
MAVTENRHRGVNTVIGTNIVPEAHLEGAVARQNQVLAAPVPAVPGIPVIIRPNPVRGAREVVPRVTAQKNQAAAPMTKAMNLFMTTMIMMTIVIIVTAIMQMAWMMRWMNWIGRKHTFAISVRNVA